MKKLLYIFLGFAFILILSLTLWFGYQAWPRPAEPELWGLSELETIPEDPAQNGWRFFEKSQGNFEDILEDLPQPLNDYVYSLDLDESPDAFWKKAQGFRSSLADYFGDAKNKHAVILQNYKELLDYPQFVDQTKPDIKTDKPPVMNLLDLNRFGTLYITHQVLEENWGEVHSILLRELRQDISWCYTSRSLINQLVSLANLQRSVEFLILLRDRYPKEQWSEIDAMLQNIDWEKINFERAIIFEYYFRLKAVDLINLEFQQKTKDPSDLMIEIFWILHNPNRVLRPLFRKIFNPSLLRQRINQEFRSYKIALQDPLHINKDFDKKINASKTPLFLRRYFSPNDVLFDLTKAPLGKLTREFYEKKAALKKKVEKLLLPQVPTESVETSSTETKP